MIIFPAIDLHQGSVVRLRQGDPQAQTVYSSDPAAIASTWERCGARWLHVVNLDGALDGPSGATTGLHSRSGDLSRLPANLQALAAIHSATALPIQYGGGLRSVADVDLALELGATRIVVGTVAIERPEIVSRLLERFGAERLVVALDGRDGRVSVRGWQSVSEVDVLGAAEGMRSLGVVRVLYTDVGRDGMMCGVNVLATAELARQSGLKVIASGGVASLADIGALAAHAADGVEGVIVGQAIYTGAVDLGAAIAAGAGWSGGDVTRG